MGDLNKTTAASAGDATIAQSEDTGCKYCSALKQVNDPEEGSCPYCADLKGETAAAGLENCKYCAASETPGTDCQYCNRPEVAAEAGADCQYCNRPEANGEQDCQYCGRGPDTKNPTTTDSEDFAGQALDAPAIPKPILGEDPQGQITPMDDTTNNNLALEGQGEANLQVSPVDGIPAAPALNPAESVQIDQSKEAMQAIAQQIEQDPAGAEAPQAAATAMATDDAALVAPAGTIVDGVSRPDSYGLDAPQSMGLAEDNAAPAPDLTAVLHEGLDAHSENIQRERVVQMVSQALTGFKACKKVIEASQQQAPQLYQSSIMMLKAMIEMAKMLGFQENGGATPTANPLEGNPQSEWQDPFPAHPDNGGAPKPEHGAPAAGGATTSGDANAGSEWADPFPKHPENGGATGGTVGQPIGKLPTSATTEHVARTPLPPGAVNAQGQKKYVDPETGKESFINMKEGRVLSPTGKPVKPPQQG